MAKPPTPLSARLLVRKEDVPEIPRPSAPKSAGKMMVSYRPSAEVYERLRDLGHAKHRKMQSLLDEAVEKLLEMYGH